MSRIPIIRTSQAMLLTAIVALLATVLSPLAFAQVTSGSIFGSVKDSTGAYVSGAQVTITAPATGLTRVVTTSESGAFVAPSLLPGTYNITIDAQGFKKLETTGVVLSAADKLNVGEMVVQIGSTTESVTVSADAGQIQLQASSGERSDLITSKQLNDVAMNGRNPLDYLKLIPGVSGSADFHKSGTGGIDAFNINGTRANQHEYTIDGASNIDTGNNGGTHVTLNTDAIEEVKVLTSNYQAEFGKAAGGQIAVATKSGSNQWHGNGRFFHRHEGLNANEWFNKRNQLNSDTPHNSPLLFRYNDIGYQVGGPIKKDKLFFFWGQEFYRQFVPIGGVSTFYVPTDDERKGDFSKSVDGNGKPIVITGTGVTNNVVDDASINKQVQAILNLYPHANASGFNNNGFYNYSIALSGNAPRREDIVRVDFQLTSKHRLYARWVHNTENDDSPFQSSWPGPFGVGACTSVINFPGGCKQEHPGWNASFNLVSTISPTILNEFSIGPSHTESRAEGANGNVSRGKNGIDMQLLFPVGDDQSIPDMGFSDLPNVDLEGGYLGGTPWWQKNTTINVNDNLTWVRGGHTLKFGAFYQRSKKDQIAWNNINGQLNFGASATAGGTCPDGPDTCTLGDPYASALLGDFQSFAQSTARPIGYFRYNQLEFYVQDTWRVTPRLTLDYGMRFAWIPPQYDAKNQIALFDPGTYDTAHAVQIDSSGNVVPDSGDPLNGMRYVSNHTLPKGGWDSRGIMPEPRIGFAYDLYNNHKTVLRGGFGMMHDRVQGNLIFNTVFNNPAIVKTAQVSANNIANLPSLGGTFSNSVQGDKNIVGAVKSGNVPTVYSYSIGIQHEIAQGTTLDLSYVGTQSRHLVKSYDVNSIPYGTAFTRAAQDPANYAGGVVPAVEPNLAPAYAAAGYSFSGAYAYGHPSYTNAPLVPYKGYGQISYIGWGGTSNYNSLQASLQRRFTRGFTMGAAYTWSKSLTSADADQDYIDPFFPNHSYRAAGWDRTHVFSANYVYDIPGVTKHFDGPKWLSYITDNFQLSGITQFMTGSPVNLGTWNGEPGAFTGGNMWGIIPYYYTLGGNQNPVLPALGNPPRGTRDLVRTGGMQNWDMSLFKNIPLRERYSIQLRLEAFNVFNHPNFNNKNYNIEVNGPFQWSYGTPAGGGSGTPDFTIAKGSGWGQYTDTYNNGGGPGGFRVLQLGAKFVF